jgi:predicted ATPase/DNA-binding XRE family transcriptional regulator
VGTVDNLSSFGYLVRRRRKALDLTQTDLANKVYCSLSTIKKIEADERRPSLLMAERLVESLQIHASDRQAFLSASSAEGLFDRLNLPDASLDRSAVHSNLSTYLPPTPFVGHKNELAELSRLINEQGYRLISLVGPGGIGKTRLALQAAEEQVARFSGGVFFTTLSQVDTPAYIPSAILDALSLPAYPVVDILSQVIEHLHNQVTLLVLDNFEHLLDGADLIVDLLHASPKLVIITTSREPLDLSMEHVFEVRGMPLDPDVVGGQVSDLDAVQLFLQTARSVGVVKYPSRQELNCILRICRLVDGMPLAIELAAAWSRTRSYEEIEMGILNGLDFLTSSMRDAGERHRSIEAAFEYSWCSLTPEEKRVFPILSVFHGGFRFDAVREIAAVQLSTLTALVNKSLLYRIASGRYEMHELLRRFSELKLLERGEGDDYYRQHMRYYLKLCESVSSGSYPGVSNTLPEEAESDNFRFALSTAVQLHEVEIELRLVINLGQFWHEKGLLVEGLTWLKQALSLDDHPPPSLKLQALIQSAWIAQDMGDFEQAILFCKQSLSLGKELGDRSSIGQALLIYGTALYLNGEFERSIRLLNKSLAIFRATDDEKDQLIALLRIADLNMRLGMLDQAEQQWRDALVLSSKLDQKKEMGFSLGGLGDIQRFRGNYAEAMDNYMKSLTIHWELNQIVDLPFVMEAMAMDFIAMRQPDKALVLLCSAENLRKEIHSPLPPSYQQSYAPFIQDLKNQIGESAFFDARQAGCSASLKQVIGHFIQSADEAEK